MSAVLAAFLVAGAVWLFCGPEPLARLARSGKSQIALPEWVRGRPDALWMPWRAVIGGSFGCGVWAFAGLPAWQLPFVAVAIGGPTVVVLGLLEPASARRRSRRLTADLPHACELLAACLDAGLPLREATRFVGEAIEGPLAAELARVTRQVDLGVNDEAAWLALTDPALRRISRDLARAAGAGLVASGPLRILAVDATVRADAVRQEVAKRVGVQSVLPLMVCFLPAFMLLGIVPIVGGYAVTLLAG